MAYQTYGGSFTVPTTLSTVTVTGLPYQPKVLLFHCACASVMDSTQAGIMHCFGAALSPTSQFTVANGSDGTPLSGTPLVGTSNAGRISRINTECVCLPLNGNPAIDALMTLVSMNSDGFTLNCTDAAATAGMQVRWTALGGADLTNAAIIEVTPTTTTNGVTQAISVPFAPDFVLTASPAVPQTASVASAATIVDANLCLGVARRSPSTQQSAGFWFENDGANTMDTAQYLSNARMGAIPGSTAVKDADFSISSWDAGGGNGITINWNDAPTALTPRIYMLFLKGGQYEIQNILAPTTAQTVSYSTAFAPQGLLGFGTLDPTDTDTTAVIASGDSGMFVGMCDSALRQGVSTFITTDGNTSSFAKRRQSASKFATYLTGTTGTVGAEASVTALSATGYTMNWSAASATVRRMVGVAFGNNPVATLEQRSFRFRLTDNEALNGAFP